MHKYISVALAGSAASLLAANTSLLDQSSGTDAERLLEPFDTISAIGSWLGESATVALFGNEAAAVAGDEYGGYLIANGSFEDGEYPADNPPSTTLQPCPFPFCALEDWEVTGSGVDWHTQESMKDPQDAEKIIDLNANAGQGAITQGVFHDEGWYRLTFYLAGPTDNSGCDYPDPVGVRVDFGNGTKNFHQAASPSTNLQWGKKIWDLYLFPYFSVLSFSSLDSTCDLGPLIDNVSLNYRDELSIYYLTPDEAENTGPVSLSVDGRGFYDGVSVQLKKDGEDPIAGYDIALENGNDTDGYLTMESTFDLTGRALGPWDLVITNTDGSVVSGQKPLDVFNGVSLHSVWPETGANIGHRTILIRGAHFVDGMNVKLSKDGETDIEAKSLRVINTGSAKATFSLNGENPGLWNVTAWKPDDDMAASTLENAFVIHELEASPKMVVTVGGNPRVRVQRYARYIVTYMNKGDMDLVGVPVIHGIPAGAPWEILSKPETYLPIPDSRPEREDPHVFLNDLDPGNPTEVLLFPITNVPTGMPATIVIRVLMENEGDYVIKATWDEFRL